MSAALSESIYAVKMARNDDLIAMALTGSNAARDELRRRLPALMDDVLKMYLAAYSDKKQVEAIMAALADIKRLIQVDGASSDESMGQPPRGKFGQVIRVGDEVVVTAKSHGRCGQIGEYAGLADSLVVQKYRICVDGDIFTVKQSEFDLI